MTPIMLEPEPNGSPHQHRYMQCTDQEIIKDGGQLDSIGGPHPKQELTGSDIAELAIGAADKPSTDVLFCKKGNQSNVAVFVKPGGSIVTLCVQGDCSTGKNAKDNQNETLKQGLKCEEEINCKGHLEKELNNKSICKGIQSINSKLATRSSDWSNDDDEENEKHEEETTEKAIKTYSDDVSCDTKNEKDLHDVDCSPEKYCETKVIVLTRIEEGDTSCCQESDQTKTHESSILIQLSKRRKRKRRRRIKEMASSTDKMGSKVKKERGGDEVTGILKAAGGKGTTGNKASTTTSSHSNTKSRTHNRQLSGSDGYGGTSGGGCGGEPPTPPKEWKRKLSCDGPAVNKKQTRRPATRLVMRQDSHSSLPSPITHGTPFVMNHSPCFSLPPTGVLPTNDLVIGDFVQHAFEHIQSETSIQRWLTHNCPPCKTMQACCNHVHKCVEPLRSLCETCTKLFEEVQSHVSVCQQSEQLMCGMDFCKGFYEGISKDAQFTLLSQLTARLSNTNTVLPQPLSYPVQRQQSVTAEQASSRKTSKSSREARSIDEADGMVTQAVPSAMEVDDDLETDSPEDSEDEAESDAVISQDREVLHRNKDNLGLQHSPRRLGPGGESPMVNSNLQHGQRQVVEVSSMQLQRQFSSEGSNRIDLDFAFRQALQRQSSSEGYGGRRRVPITDTNRSAFVDHLMNKPYRTTERLQSDDSSMGDVSPPAMWKREIDEDEEPTAIRRHVRYGEKRHMRAFLPIWADLQKQFCEGCACSDELMADYEEGVLFCEGLQVVNNQYKNGDQYATMGTLGTGAFGKVYLCKDHNTNYEFVVKVIDLVHFNPDEAYIWSEMDHPNIVRLLGVVRNGSTVYFFSEFRANMTLKNLVQNGRVMSQGEALYHMQALLNVLRYVHEEKGVVHKDLKPENLLVTSEGRLLLIDWGLSKLVENPPLDAEKNPEGTQQYMAPEIARCDPYGFGADIWSAMCIGIHLISGYPPWLQRCGNIPLLFFVIGTKSPPVEDIPEDTHPDVKDLLTLGMTVKPNDRPEASQLLRHQAFKLTQKLQGVNAVNEVKLAANPPPEDDWQPHFAAAPEDAECSISFQDPSFGMAMISQQGHGNRRFSEVILQQRLDMERRVSGFDAENGDPSEPVNYEFSKMNLGDGEDDLMVPAVDDLVTSPEDDPMASQMDEHYKLYHEESVQMEAVVQDPVTSPEDEHMASTIDEHYMIYRTESLQEASAVEELVTSPSDDPMAFIINEDLDRPEGIQIASVADDFVNDPMPFPVDDARIVYSPKGAQSPHSQNGASSMNTVQMPNFDFSGLPNVECRIDINSNMSLEQIQDVVEEIPTPFILRPPNDYVVEETALPTLQQNVQEDKLDGSLNQSPPNTTVDPSGIESQLLATNVEQEDLPVPQPSPHDIVSAMQPPAFASAVANPVSGAQPKGYTERDVDTNPQIKEDHDSSILEKRNPFKFIAQTEPTSTSTSSNHMMFNKTPFEIEETQVSYGSIPLTSVGSDIDLYGPSLDDFNQENFQPKQSSTSDEDSQGSQPLQTSTPVKSSAPLVTKESETRLPAVDDGTDVQMTPFQMPLKATRTKMEEEEPVVIPSTCVQISAPLYQSTPDGLDTVHAAIATATLDEPKGAGEETVIPQPAFAPVSAAPTPQQPAPGDLGTTDYMSQNLLLGGTNMPHNQTAMTSSTPDDINGTADEPVIPQPAVNVTTTPDPLTLDDLPIIDVLLQSSLSGPKASTPEVKGAEEPVIPQPTYAPILTAAASQPTKDNLRTADFMSLSSLSGQQTSTAEVKGAEELLMLQTTRAPESAAQRTTDDLRTTDVMSRSSIGRNLCGQKASTQELKGAKEPVIPQPTHAPISTPPSQPTQDDRQTSDFMSQSSLGGSLCGRRARNRPIKLAAVFNEASTILDTVAPTVTDGGQQRTEHPQIQVEPQAATANQLVGATCRESDGAGASQKLGLLAETDTPKGSLMEFKPAAEEDDIQQFLEDDEDMWRFQGLEAFTGCMLNGAAASTSHGTSPNTGGVPTSFDMEPYKPPAHLSLGKSASNISADEEYNQFMTSTLMQQAHGLQSPEDQLKMMTEALDISWQISHGDGMEPAFVDTSGIYTASSPRDESFYSPPALKDDEESIATLQKQLSTVSVVSNSSSVGTTGTKLTIVVPGSSPISVKMRHERTIKDLAVGISAKVPSQIAKKFTLQTKEGLPLPESQPIGCDEQTLVLIADPSDCDGWEWCVRSQTGSVEYPGDGAGCCMLP